MAWTRVVLPVPSSPESPTTAGARRSRPSASPNRLSSSADRRMTDRVPVGPELEDLVAQHRGELEIELLRGGLHLALEQPNESLSLLRIGGPVHPAVGRLGRLGVREPRREPHLVDRLHDRARSDSMLLVIRELHL